MGENIFKFIFGTQGDRDRIYRNRLWSFDGAHLMLKPWPKDQVVKDIPFDTTTLWIQIYGLPLAMIHEGTVERIGNRIGTVHRETINRKCVVVHSYLQFRVDIPVTNPIPANFFFRKDR